MVYRVFLDMDGVLCVFNKHATVQDLHTLGYFRGLQPMVNVVNAAKILCNIDCFDVFILSAVLSDNPSAEDEKNEWLDQYLPEISQDYRIFPPCNVNKALYVPDGIKGSDLLVDDYTANLNRWTGISLKMLNGINHTHGTWTNEMVSHLDDPEDIALKIIFLCQS